MIRCTVFFALAIAASAVAETSKPDISQESGSDYDDVTGPDYGYPGIPVISPSESEQDL